MSEWTKEQDQPAMTMAAIRWYALSIEKLSTELYVTNPGNFPQLQQALNDALTALEALRAPRASAMTAMSAMDSVCPPGYKDCDGICLPKCPSGPA